MSFTQNWAGAKIRTGHGGSGGGHGGSVGSNNHVAHTSPRYGATYEGDSYNGSISGGNVGGRNNRNTINNRAQDDDDSEDDEMAAQIALLQAQLKAKRDARNRK